MNCVRNLLCAFLMFAATKAELTSENEHLSAEDPLETLVLKLLDILANAKNPIIDDPDMMRSLNHTIGVISERLRKGNGKDDPSKISFRVDLPKPTRVGPTRPPRSHP